MSRALTPYTLVIEGTEHECPLPDVRLEEGTWMFHSDLQFSSEVFDNFDFVWFVDESSYHLEGNPYMGFPVTQAAEDGLVICCIQRQCVPHSAQAAGVVGVIAALENTPLDQSVVICSDSD